MCIRFKEKRRELEVNTHFTDAESSDCREILISSNMRSSMYLICI